MFGAALRETVKMIVQKYLNEMKPTELIYGEVTSDSPLKIKVDNRFELDETFLILGQNVRETWIKIPEQDDFKHLHEIPNWQTDLGGVPPHIHTISPWKTEEALPKIKLWRGLKTGDKVLMFRVKQGGQYLVLERVEGVKNDA